MSTIAEREAPPRRAVAVPDGFDPVPSIGRVQAVEISVVEDVPGDAEAVAIPVGAAGDGATTLGVAAEALTAVGFDGGPGQTHAVATRDGPLRIGVGLGDATAVDAAAIRDAAGAFALAAKRPGNPPPHNRLPVLVR